jgi:hypothetical protein
VDPRQTKNWHPYDSNIYYLVHVTSRKTLPVHSHASNTAFSSSAPRSSSPPPSPCRSSSLHHVHRPPKHTAATVAPSVFAAFRASSMDTVTSPCIAPTITVRQDGPRIPTISASAKAEARLPQSQTICGRQKDSRSSTRQRPKVSYPLRHA